MSDAAKALEKLVAVVNRLIAPDGCPWDREQTPETLCDYVIEESHELVSAIRANDSEEARGELGDVAFMLVFIAKLYEKRGDFDLGDALESAAAKMIRRHPHVFDGLAVSGQDELLKNWERIKRGEKKDPGGVFDSLPPSLPPLLKAYRINAKASRHNFTWDSDQDQADSLAREWDELRQAAESGDKDRIEEEFGDYLFSLAEYGRRLGVKCNAALEKANLKFLRRFSAVEGLAKQRGLDTAKFALADWDALWDEVKAGEGKE